LAPSDFWLSCHIKTSLADCVFNDVDELLEAVVEFLNDIWPPESQFGFHHWIEREKLVLAKIGDHCHEETTDPEFGRQGPFWRATVTTYDPSDI
jgi:hypothetical protein